MSTQSAPLRVAVVFGTRPEAVKMAPVVAALQDDPAFETKVVFTGQHRELAAPILAHFGITPDYDLDVMRSGQSLPALTARIVAAMETTLQHAKPNVVLVHGDTSTCFAAGLASFYARIPVGHVEAGLRSGRRDDPFPEEMHRRLTTELATWHYAPTVQARSNLLQSGVVENRIVVTGNTVIDALRSTVHEHYEFINKDIEELVRRPGRIILVTAHRRDNWGSPLINIAVALRQLLAKCPDIHIVFSLHVNPHVRQVVAEQLHNEARVTLLESPAYPDFVNLLARVHLVLTDSGGLQEEGPALGKPVLVLRQTTERPEAIQAGVCRLVGTDSEHIVAAAHSLLTDSSAYKAMARAVNPYGDGRAARRIADHLKGHYAR